MTDPTPRIRNIFKIDVGGTAFPLCQNNGPRLRGLFYFGTGGIQAGGTISRKMVTDVTPRIRNILELTHVARRSLSAKKEKGPEAGAFLFFGPGGIEAEWAHQGRSVTDPTPRIRNIFKFDARGAAFPLRQSDNRRQTTGISARSAKASLVDITVDQNPRADFTVAQSRHSGYTLAAKNNDLRRMARDRATGS